MLHVQGIRLLTLWFMGNQLYLLTLNQPLGLHKPVIECQQLLLTVLLLCSPRGERVRSRVELTSVLEGHIDLTTFEYKTGKFYDGEAPPIRIRHRIKVPLAFIV